MQEIVKETDKLILDGRNKLTLNNVASVDGFSSQMLRLTVGSDKIIIGGEKIKITAYNKSTGNFAAEGLFNEIKYFVKKDALLKRIFR